MELLFFLALFVIKNLIIITMDLNDIIPSHSTFGSSEEEFPPLVSYTNRLPVSNTLVMAANPAREMIEIGGRSDNNHQDI